MRVRVIMRMAMLAIRQLMQEVFFWFQQKNGKWIPLVVRVHARDFMRREFIREGSESADATSHTRRSRGVWCRLISAD